MRSKILAAAALLPLLGAPAPALAQAGGAQPLSIAPPATIGASSSWTSACQKGPPFPGIGVNATLSQNGSIQVQRFSDPACTIAIGINFSQTLTAAAAGWLFVDDGVAFQSFEIVISNSSGSTGALSGFYAFQSYP